MWTADMYIDYPGACTVINSKYSKQLAASSIIRNKKHLTQ